MSEIISFACSLDFGYVKPRWSEGKAVPPDLCREHAVEYLSVLVKVCSLCEILVKRTKNSFQVSIGTVLVPHPLPVFVFPRTDPSLSWVNEFFTRQLKTKHQSTCLLITQSFSHKTPPVSMIPPDNISVATCGQIIVRNKLKCSDGSLICLFCLLLFCSGVRVGKCVIKP